MISIIVPVYNCEKYIARCINSILKQTYQNIECIVMDDGSTDDTAKICDSLSKTDKRVKVFHKENRGVQATREDAINYCNGDYVMFVDADDYIVDTILESALKKMEQYDVDIICFNYVTRGRKGFNIHEEMVIDSDTALKYMLSFKNLDGNLWCKLYKLEIVKGISFDERLHCNFITCAEIIRHAAQIAVVPLIGYYYSTIEGSITNYKKCNPRITEFEKTAFDFYEHIKREEPKLKLEAEYFWLRSLLWTNIKMEKDSTLKRKNSLFEKEKRLLRKMCNRFLKNPYFSFKDKIQFGLCYFNAFRFAYTIRHNIKWGNEYI